MFEYKYVRIDGKSFISSKFESHRDVIDEHARQGYRFVGFIPVKIESYGKINEIDLVFEKQID